MKKAVMKKAVLISIHPEWCCQIENGNKIYEIRKNRPKLSTPFKCYIYCTSLVKPFKGGYIGLRKVIGEFICDSIEEFVLLKPPKGSDYTATKIASDGGYFTNIKLDKSCVTLGSLIHYIGFHKSAYAWHISDLVIYDQPKELIEFSRYWDDDNDTRPCDDCEHYIYDEINYALLCTEKHWGDPCPKMILTRPPQSWCYVEELSCYTR